MVKITDSKFTAKASFISELADDSFQNVMHVLNNVKKAVMIVADAVVQVQAPEQVLEADVVPQAEQVVAADVQQVNKPIHSSISKPEFYHEYNYSIRYQ
jgi:uncharacterized protein YktB (UPF0637 family)